MLFSWMQQFVISPRRSWPKVLALVYAITGFSLFVWASDEDLRTSKKRSGLLLKYPMAVGNLAQPIKVNTCNFFCQFNAEIHHTEKYELVHGKDPTPVLRRGEPFYMAIQFNRPFNVDVDNVKLELAFGPKTTRGYVMTLPVTSARAFTKKSSKWDVHMSHQENATVTLRIQIPYTAGVGLWRMKIISKINGHNHANIHSCKEDIYILFNPWSKEDQVYMKGDVNRQEYVLNDVGKLYQGYYRHPLGKPWIFGQFEAIVLEACEFLLEMSGLDFLSRGNPIKVSRAISAIINSDDDNGTLTGRWEGTFDDGVHPGKWTGSVDILERYLTSGGIPVKYGQCWVFSGVCTTVFRAIGIPCRSVTNFDSGHDKDDTMTIDVLYTANFIQIEGGDSEWNFHVWNDCWMARPDLPAGYGGWQTVDSTPQEPSEGIFQLGPASVRAVRQGDTDYLYDAPFIFGEVNADQITWLEVGNNMKMLEMDTSHIGKKVVTKKVGEYGDNDMEDITLQYKAEEETVEERETVLNAVNRSGSKYMYDVRGTKLKRAMKDVHFELREIDQVMIGQSFKVVVGIENRSDGKRTVTLGLGVSTVYYTGKIARTVKRKKKTFYLHPGQRRKLWIKVTADQYLDKLVDYSLLKMYAISTVKETQQTWAKQDDFQFAKPPLIIETDGQPNVKERFNITFSFTNPLEYSLEGCALEIEGPGFLKHRETLLNNIGPHMTMTYVEELAPRKAGPQIIAATFWSLQLADVSGSKVVTVDE